MTVIFVKLITGSTITVEVELETDTVQMLRDKLSDKEAGSHIQFCRLVFAGKELKDLDHKLCQYNLQKECLIHCVLKVDK